MPDQLSLLDRLDDDLKDAMRNRDKVRLRTLRSLRTALKEKEISKRGSGDAELTDQEALAVVRKQAKQRKDAIEQYEDAGRTDLVDKEQEELDVIDEYLPKPLSDEELDKELRSVIEEVNASSMADMGKVMGLAMGRLRGRVDGGRVQKRVQHLLSNQE